MIVGTGPATCGADGFLQLLLFSCVLMFLYGLWLVFLLPAVALQFQRELGSGKVLIIKVLPEKKTVKPIK